MINPAKSGEEAWQSVIESLGEAGRRMDEATRGLSPEERADGFRALARALSNQLGRLEVDDASPELESRILWPEAARSAGSIPCQPRRSSRWIASAKRLGITGATIRQDPDEVLERFQVYRERLGVS